MGRSNIFPLNFYVLVHINNHRTFPYMHWVAAIYIVPVFYLCHFIVNDFVLRFSDFNFFFFALLIHKRLGGLSVRIAFSGVPIRVGENEELTLSVPNYFTTELYILLYTSYFIHNTLTKANFKFWDLMHLRYSNLPFL